MYGLFSDSLNAVFPLPALNPVIYCFSGLDGILTVRETPSTIPTTDLAPHDKVGSLLVTA